MRHISLLLASLLLAGNALADEGADLAKKSGCMTCHAVDKKVVGPAFKDVAAKYKGDAAAADKLAKSIREGSKGNFGAVMPPQSKVSEGDAKLLAGWVLKLN